MYLKKMAKNCFHELVSSEGSKNRMNALVVKYLMGMTAKIKSMLLCT